MLENWSEVQWYSICLACMSEVMSLTPSAAIKKQTLAEN
jgi:hypothetical protein